MNHATAQPRAAAPAARSKPGNSPKLREITLDDYAQIASLSAPYRFATSLWTEEQWRHVWINNPVHKRLAANFPAGWVLEADRRIVGHVGRVPLFFQLDGQQLLVSYGYTYVVEPEYRGYAPLLLDQYENQKDVEIRGYRIEPAEIEAAMAAHASISASAVLARADSADEKRLVGYVVTNANLTRGELQAFLLDRLPDYMVPPVFVALSSLPLTASGKIDYNALPLPTSENTLHDESEAANSVTEETLARIASELLRVPEIGPDDDFFLLGGHSLLGTQLIVRIREAFDIEIPLRTLFEEPTVQGLAAVIEQSLAAKPPSTRPRAA